MNIFDWHGFRAGLAGEEAINAELSAGVTHVGIPMHHTDGYVGTMASAGLQIVRTMEPPWNAGRDNHNLGKILAEYQTHQTSGEFFRQYVDNLQGPIDGIGWNMEHRALDIDITPEDREWWGKYAKKLNLVYLRCLQFSILLRLYQRMASKKFKKHIPTFVYSGYQGVAYCGRQHLPLQEAYSVDWRILCQPTTYRGLVYPAVDYSVCAWHGLNLTTTAVRRQSGQKILHNLGLPEYDGEQRWDDYETLMKNRMDIMNADDGLALVACSPMTGPWNWQEFRLREIIHSVLSERNA